MKWSNTQGKTAMDGGFKKHGHECPLLLARPLPTSSSISLVKSAFSLSCKTKFYAGRAGRPPHRPAKLICVYLWNKAFPPHGKHILPLQIIRQETNKQAIPESCRYISHNP